MNGQESRRKKHGAISFIQKFLKVFCRIHTKQVNFKVSIVKKL